MTSQRSDYKEKRST